MSKTFVGGTRHPQLAPSQFTAWWQYILSVDGETSVSDETQTQIQMTCAGTFSLLGWHVGTSSADRTVRFRKNTANGNQVYRDQTGVDAWYYDTTNTDHVVSGDMIDVQTDSVTFAVDIYGFTGLFEADDGSTTSLPNATFTQLNPSGVYTWSVFGGNVGRAEAVSQQKIRASATLSKMQVNVISAAGTDFIFKLRKNGADGTSSITLPSSTTGVFIASGSDTLANGDLINYYCNFTVLAGSVTWNMQSQIAWDSFTYDIGNITSASGRAASATTHYYPLVGFGNVNQTVETDVQLAFKYAGASLSKFRCNVALNTYADTVTCQLRKNTGNANQSFTITNGTTGWFEDSTNTDTFAASDVWDWSIVGGTSGSLTIVTWLVTVKNNSELRNDSGFYTLTGETARLSLTLNSLLPISDVSIGSWTTNTGSTSNLYATIDEITPNDADYCQSRIFTAGGTDATQFGFTPTDPPIDTRNYVLTYRFQKDGIKPTNFVVSLYDGATLVGSWTHNNISTGFTTVSQTLSTSQIDLITDYGNLQMKADAQVTS